MSYKITPTLDVINSDGVLQNAKPIKDRSKALELIRALQEKESLEATKSLATKEGRTISASTADRLNQIASLVAELLKADADEGDGEEPDDWQELPDEGETESAPGKAISKREDITDAERARLADEGGKFADTVNKRYKLNTEAQIHAAWSYIGMPKNQKKYSAAEVTTLKNNIIKAWKAKIDKEGPPSAAEGKAANLPEDDTVIAFGGEIKALESSDDGLKIGGYLVRFGDANNADLSETHDYFTKDTDFGNATETDVYFNHCMPVKSSTGTAEAYVKKLGKATLKPDDVGIWAEMVYKAADDYQKMIAEMVKTGKLSWSSGTAAHLVQRKSTGNANEITRWPLGLDGSPTPTPAEFRNTILPLKSLPSLSTVLQAANAGAELTNKESITMDENLKKEITELISSAVKAAMPAPQMQGGITQVLEKKQAPPVVQDATDDNDGMKAMSRFIRWGDIANDLRQEVGSKYYPGAVDSKTGVKTTYNWNEGSANDGYALVPPEFWKVIVEKRYEMSIVRASGCQVFPCGTNKMMVPAEYTREPIFVKTTEATGEADQTTTEPVTQKELDIFLYSRKIPVSIQLLQDSIYPVEGFVSSRLAHAAALTENSLFLATTGNGASDVEGVFPGGSAGKTFASATTIAVGEPQDLFYAVPSYYQAESVWYMRNATLGVLRKLTTTWFAYQPTPAGQTTGKGAGNVGGTSETLQYHNIWVSDYCPAIGAGLKSMICGNPEFYAIAENQGMVIQRNPYDDAKHFNVNFYAYIRLGGGVLQAEAWQYGVHPSGS